MDDNIPTTMTKEEFKDLLYESYVQKWSPTTFRRKLQPRLKLEKWTYPELRDVINNSSDVKEIENCQKELHRREEAYYDWKVKNRQSKKDCRREFYRRLHYSAWKPKNAVLTTMDQKQENNPHNRYFKVHFLRPNINPSEPMKSGWMYLHFYGRSVARQMELPNADQPPILSVSGNDDMLISELSLEDSGLTRKRGAEILEREFNQEWIRNGGQPYEKVTNSY